MNITKNSVNIEKYKEKNLPVCKSEFQQRNLIDYNRLAVAVLGRREV
jgi:hypothetical protein